jgi:DNA-binding NarL/FixJ family response regulator
MSADGCEGTNSRPLEGVRLVVTGGHALLLDALVSYLEREGAEVVGTSQDHQDLERLAFAHRPDACIFEHRLEGGACTAAVAKKVHEALPGVRLLGLANSLERPTVEAALLDAAVRGSQGLEPFEHTLLQVLDRRPQSAPSAAGTDPSPSPSVSRSDLSTRETEVLRLLVLGASNGRIAEQLGISVNTVRTHVHNLLQKLGKHRRVEAALLSTTSGEYEARLALP